MKKLVTILSAIAVTAALAAPASATQFWLENFSYGNGALATVGVANWSIYSGAGTDIAVTGGVAVGNHANAPDDNRGFTARSATDSTFACMQVTIPTPGTLPIVGNYFALFKDGTLTNFNARLFVLPVAGSSGVYNYAIGVSSVNTTTMPAIFPLNCTFGTSYNVVIEYCAAAPGYARLWVNPASKGSTNVMSNTTTNTNGGSGVLINNFALRQSSSGSPATGTVSWTYNVDNVGVATTFEDACTGSVTPAQNTTWGQLKRTYR